MAGRKEEEVEDYKKKTTSRAYRGVFMPGYKQVYELEDWRSGELVYKTYLELAIETAENLEFIDDIVIIGDAERINAKLKDRLKKSPKKLALIDQAENIDDKVLEATKVNKPDVPYMSFCENALKGYSASTSYEKREHALFMFSDTPLLEPGYLTEFTSLAQKHFDSSCIIYPLVNMERESKEMKKRLRRKNFYLINDTPYLTGDGINKGKMKPEGFRVSAYAYANPFHANFERINLAYSLRKFLSYEVQVKLFKTLRKVELGGLFWKYCMLRKLRISDIENAATQLFAREGKVTIIPTEDIKSTYDFDSFQHEHQTLQELLRREVTK
jgi:hypothetical protein